MLTRARAPWPDIKTVRLHGDAPRDERIRLGGEQRLDRALDVTQLTPPLPDPTAAPMHPVTISLTSGRTREFGTARPFTGTAGLWDVRAFPTFGEFPPGRGKIPQCPLILRAFRPLPLGILPKTLCAISAHLLATFLPGLFAGFSRTSAN